jgi:S-adenosylmethionine decarboxylase
MHEGQQTFGTELILDLAGCDLDAISSGERIAAFATELCRLIDMRAYGAPIVERFGLADLKTAGYTLVQLIETSSIVAHFSEAWGTAYINVFSCRPFDPDVAADYVRDVFGAQEVRKVVLIRR